MHSGTVKWFDVKKGFGFIVGPDGQDVFVHFSSILGDGFRTLKDGEQVDYEMLQGDKGFHAREVRRAGSVVAPAATATPAIALAAASLVAAADNEVTYAGLNGHSVDVTLPAGRSFAVPVGSEADGVLS